MSRNKYLKVLLVELNRRRRKNPQYSERAFARDLKISPSVLNEVLRGKQGLSRKSAESIAQKLNLSEIEVQNFCDYVDVAHGRSDRVRKQAAERLKKRRLAGRSKSLTSDELTRFGDWTHFVVMEITKLKQFVPSPDWIAARLGVTRAKVQESLDALQKHGLLKVRDGKIDQLGPSTDALLPNHPAIAAAQEFLLDRAKKAIRMPPSPRRWHYSLMVALDEKELEELKEMLRAFRAKVHARLEETESTSKQSVYCLNLLLFDLLTEAA